MSSLYRYRDLSDGEKFTGGTYLQKNSAGAVIVNQATMERVSSHFLQVIDYSVSDWRKRLARGEIINNPYGRLTITSEISLGTEVQHEIAFPLSTNAHTNRDMVALRYVGVTGGLSLPLGPANTALETAIAKAKLDCLAGVDSTPYDMLEDLAEADKSLKTLRQPLHQALSAARQFKADYRVLQNSGLRRGLSASAASLKAASVAWLTARFGFAPLIYTGLNLLESLSPTSRIRPRYARLRSRSHTGDSNEWHASTVSSSGAHKFREDSKFTIDVRAGLLYRASNPLDTFGNYGIRVKDIPRTVWAVMPYSWVIDRVLNISQGIKALTNLIDPSISYDAGWVSYTLNAELLVQHTGLTPNPGWVVDTFAPTSRKTNYVVKSRQPWTPNFMDVVPRPTLYPFGNFSKTADLLSLILSNIRYKSYK